MEKEKAFESFMEMTFNSWTYQKMTMEEKKRFIEMMHHVRTQKSLRGNYNQRWDTLQAIYGAYLEGIGYSGWNWREESEVF